jgi:hypothetical protein
LAVDGKYNITMNTPMGSRQTTLELKADGSSLGGTWVGQGGPQEFSGGSVDGDNVSWSVNMSGPMGAMTLAFKGKVEGDNINGDVQFGSFGSGTFTGTRAT